VTVFVLKRVGIAIPVLIGVTLLVFLILRLIPGDPAQILLFGSNPTPDAVAHLRSQLGLDKPAPVQYLLYLKRLATGDLGFSYASNTPVLGEITQRLPFTLNLTLYGMFVALVVGIPLGIGSGLRPGSWLDRLATGGAVLGLAMPYFWLAELLVLLFAVRLKLLPALGLGSTKALILPAVSLGWGFAAVIARLLRASLIEVYQQPYILVAKAKGIAGTRLLVRHALRNALSSVVTIVGLQIGNMLAGAVAIEVIFGRPGLGSYLVSRIQQKDIPSIQGVVLFVAISYLLVNLAVDVLHAVLDPRIRQAATR
jgi:ABC-type dipeptide/oligopeptide/nickel transport system permease component